MKLLSVIRFFRHPSKKWSRLLLLALLVLSGMDSLPFVVDKEHAHTRVEHLPGMWTVFGLLGCILIVLVSKKFGHAGIMQREEYYDE